MYRLGIDVGGTFTDLVAVDDSGRVTLAKAASTPSDPSLGVMDGMEMLAAALGHDLPTLLAETEHIVHGTTVATNALLERKGAKIGLLTTEGHRDIIEMREGLKDERYNLRLPPPIPLVPRALRIGVRERPPGRDVELSHHVGARVHEPGLRVVRRRRPRRRVQEPWPDACRLHVTDWRWSRLWQHWWSPWPR